MKISNSKKELARIISENGGWRVGSEWAWYGPLTGMGYFGTNKPAHNKELKCMTTYGVIGGNVHTFECSKIANWHQTILSSEEYFHLYPAPDGDGWVECRTGFCPIADAEFVDVRFRDGGTDSGIAGGWNWSLDGIKDDIIAYRLRKPEQAKPEFCGSVTRSIPEPEVKPTIEQLAADYRNRKDYSDRKQEEADAAKADAEAKLAELVAAGKALNLVISVTEKESELVITDWRDLKVDDVISVQCFEKVYSQSTVLAVGVSDVLIKNHVGARKTVNLDERDWSFIRRP